MKVNSQDLPNEANLSPTPILDYNSTEIQTLKNKLSESNPSPRDLVCAAHKYFSDEMNAVYSIDEQRPVSETIRLNGGSCGQRMACVEALARAYGVPTRVRALWLSGEFWRWRLPLLRFVMPKRTLMPWSQFYFDGKWTDFDELYAPIYELAAHSAAKHPFTNKGESLYSAVSRTAVDFLGKLKGTNYASFDISNYVVGDDGFFDTRDEVLEKFDQRSWFGKFIFNLFYGGRPIKRIQE